MTEIKPVSPKAESSKTDEAPREPRILVIHNPAAGRGRGRLQATLARLRGLGGVPDIRATAGPGDAETLARTAVERGYDLVVAAGGDGTVNEAVNGLIGSGLPLALLPLGTANVLAIEIGLDLEPGALAQTILHGRPVDVCLGRIRGADGAARLFTTMAGAGADAHAVAGVNLVGKRVLGTGAYYAEMVRQFFVFPFPNYRITVDGTAYDAASVVVSNGRHYAGKFLLAPDANLAEPSFQVSLFERSGRRAALRYVMALQRDRLAEAPDFRIVSGREIRIEGPEGDPVQADGDIVAVLPVDIQIVPGALKLLMPAGA